MEKEKIEKYIDEYIKHVIDFQLYGNMFCKQVRKIIKDSVDKIFNILNSHESITTKVQCNKVRTDVNKELDLLLEQLNDYVISKVAHVVQRENKWTNTRLSDFLEVELKTDDKDKEKLLNMPVADAGIVSMFGENVVNKYRSLFFDAIATSYITGMIISDLSSSFDGRLKAINRGVDAESQTIGSSLGSLYDRIIYTRNTKLIKGYIWSAILDSSTCLVCGHLDGTIYKNIAKVPLYPVHYRCRCFLIPFTEEIEEIMPSSYAEWFEKQNDEEKRTILGKSRFQLYKDGMKIGDFVNNGQLIPLNKLKTKNKV